MSDIVPVRLRGKLKEVVDALVKEGIYGSKSEVIRDGIRRVGEERGLITKGAVGERPPEARTAGDVMRTLKRELPHLKERFKVKSIELFGSYVRGEQEEGSDLDVLVEFEGAPSLLKFIEMENHLSDILGVKVDLVMKDALKPAIGKRILEEVVPV